MGEGGIAGHGQPAEAVLLGSQEVGLHLPDIRLHDPSQEVERVQPAQVPQCEGVGKEPAVGSVHLRQDHAGHEHPHRAGA